MRRSLSKRFNNSTSHLTILLSRLFHLPSFMSFWGLLLSFFRYSQYTGNFWFWKVVSGNICILLELKCLIFTGYLDVIFLGRVQLKLHQLAWQLTVSNWRSLSWISHWTSTGRKTTEIPYRFQTTTCKDEVVCRSTASKWNRTFSTMKKIFSRQIYCGLYTLSSSIQVMLY